MLSEEEISAQLKDIKAIRKRINSVLWSNSENAYDLMGIELNQENIKRCIKEIAKKIVEDYEDEFPVIVGLLDGAFPFATQLHEVLVKDYPDFLFQLTFMQTSSYHGGTQSGDLKLGSMKVEVGERLVIVLDDVIDKGITYAGTRDKLMKSGASDVHLVALVDKVQKRPECYGEANITGFRVNANDFLIGFGLDYANVLRDKTSIKVANPQFLLSVEEEALLKSEKGLNEQLKAIKAAKNLDVSPGRTPSAMFVHSSNNRGCEDKFASISQLQ